MGDMQEEGRQEEWISRVPIMGGRKAEGERADVRMMGEDRRVCIVWEVFTTV